MTADDMIRAAVEAAPPVPDETRNRIGNLLPPATAHQVRRPAPVRRQREDHAA